MTGSYAYRLLTLSSTIVWDMCCLVRYVCTRDRVYFASLSMFAGSAVGLDVASNIIQKLIPFSSILLCFVTVSQPSEILQHFDILTKHTRLLDSDIHTPCHQRGRERKEDPKRGAFAALPIPMKL